MAPGKHPYMVLILYLALVMIALGAIIYREVNVIQGKAGMIWLVHHLMKIMRTSNQRMLNLPNLIMTWRLIWVTVCANLMHNILVLLIGELTEMSLALQLKCVKIWSHQNYIHKSMFQSNCHFFYDLSIASDCDPIDRGHMELMYMWSEKNLIFACVCFLKAWNSWPGIVRLWSVRQNMKFKVVESKKRTWAAKIQIRSWYSYYIGRTKLQ